MLAFGLAAAVFVAGSAASALLPDGGLARDDALVSFAIRALADAPVEVGWYGGEKVAIYTFTETDDNAESVASGAAEARLLLPQAPLLLLGVDNSRLSKPLAHFGGFHTLYSLLAQRNVTVRA